MHVQHVRVRVRVHVSASLTKSQDTLVYFRGPFIYTVSLRFCYVTLPHKNASDCAFNEILAFNCRAEK